MEYVNGFAGKKFGLLGEHLSHSFSPLIHSLLADYPYALYEVDRDVLGEWVKNNDLWGYNVTIPYKTEIMKYCDEISPQAQMIGAVNTVVRRSDGTLFGDNTDYFGFSYMLNSLSIDVQGAKALVLGSGGASKTVCAVLKSQGADVVVISRNGENNYQNLHLHRDAVLIVNTTPVGMYPNTGVSPVDLSVFPQCKGVCDVIYNPAKTALVLQAEELGIPFVNGLSMLVAQAHRACEVFTDSSISESVIERIRREVMSRTLNIVLVGMPGCGKSTVGRLVADSLSRPFVDADEEIEKTTGRTPAQIIKEEGEPAFRLVESQILKTLCKESGAVIATGGGAVTIPENKYVIRQNSVVIFLERNISVLSTEDRPLSTDLASMYQKRLPFYKDFSHITVDGNTEAQAVAQSVVSAFSEVINED
ncbi:MAG: shikimate kinase [Ruminococcaceae bacterium]|nr:shikimate kinase [Oscillospiraceae bacterium]